MNDPKYKALSVASEEVDVDGLQLRGEIPSKPVEVVHGLGMELLFSTLASGTPARSTVNTVGGHLGVYAAGIKDLSTAKAYSTAVPLGNDGIYFRAVLELRVQPDKYLKSNNQTKGHFVFQPEFCRIMAIRFYARHVNDMTYGNVWLRLSWDPFLEFRGFSEHAAERVAENITLPATPISRGTSSAAAAAPATPPGPAPPPPGWDEESWAAVQETKVLKFYKGSWDEEE